MTAKYRHEGKIVDLPVPQTAGDILDYGAGGFVAVVVATSTADDLKANGQIEGVFEVTKKNASDVASAGDPVTLDATDDTVTTVAGPHRLVRDTANGDTTAYVKINTGMPTT